MSKTAAAFLQTGRMKDGPSSSGGPLEARRAQEVARNGPNDEIYLRFGSIFPL